MEVQWGRQMLWVSWREEPQITAQRDILELLLQEELHVPEACQAGKTEWTRLLQVLAGLCQGAISRSYICTAGLGHCSLDHRELSKQGLVL